jgi:hypothetical protein
MPTPSKEKRKTANIKKSEIYKFVNLQIVNGDDKWQNCLGSWLRNELISLKSEKLIY